MEKNEIISAILTRLLTQRGELNEELKSLNHNDASFMEKRITLQNAINDIDMQIDRRVMDMELRPI